MMGMGKKAGWMVCFHDDTHMMFTHGDSARKADRELASNANINMSYGVSISDYDACARFGATVNREGKFLSKELKKGFGKSALAAPDHARPGAYPVCTPHHKLHRGTHGGRTANSGSQSYHHSHAAATDGTQSRAPETLGVVDVFSSSFSSLHPLPSPVHHLPGCSQLELPLVPLNSPHSLHHSDKITMATTPTVRSRRPSTSAPVAELSGPIGPAGITRPKHKRTITGFGASDIKSVEAEIPDAQKSA